MFLLFFQGPLYLVINFSLVLDLPIILTLHLLWLRSDNLLKESLLRILCELLKPLLSLFHDLRKLLSLVKVRVIHNRLLIVLLFDNLLCQVFKPLFELALHDILRLLLLLFDLFFFFLALDLLGLMNCPHYRDFVLVKLPLSLFDLHSFLLVQNRFELLPNYCSAVCFYLSLLHLLLL